MKKNSKENQNELRMKFRPVTFMKNGMIYLQYEFDSTLDGLLSAFAYANNIAEINNYKSDINEIVKKIGFKGTFHPSKVVCVKDGKEYVIPTIKFKTAPAALLEPTNIGDVLKQGELIYDAMPKEFKNGLFPKITSPDSLKVDLVAGCCEIDKFWGVGRLDDMERLQDVNPDALSKFASNIYEKMKINEYNKTLDDAINESDSFIPENKAEKMEEKLVKEHQKAVKHSKKDIDSKVNILEDDDIMQ